MYKIFFITEASKEIGTGHLKECLSVAKSLSQNYYIEFYLLSSDRKISSLIPFKTTFWEDIQDAYTENQFDIGILNLRNNHVQKQRIAKSFCNKLVVIDELGGIEVIADVLINPSITPQWHRYTVSFDCRFYIGPRYFFVDEKALKEVSKNYRKSQKNIMVSMGGADRSNATYGICRVLRQLRDYKKLIILGPMFPVKAEREIKKVIGYDGSFFIKKNPKYFLELLARQSMLITAGGNTLCEAVFFKIPSIVLYEDKHELEQGREFQKLGVAKVVGSGVSFDKRKLLNAITSAEKWFSPQEEIIDGKGIGRIKSIIDGLCQKPIVKIKNTLT